MSMNEKQVKYFEGRLDRFIEESIREDGTFDKEWFKSNMKSVINEILDNF